MVQPGTAAPGAQPATGVREFLLAGYQRLEHRVDAAFGSLHNPLRQLGAIAFALFWLLAISGIYLYIVLDTSA